MKYLEFIILIFIFSCMTSKAQPKYLSGGIELGMIQNWTKVTKDETGIFINNQNLGFNITESYQRVFLKYNTTQFNIKVDYTRAIYSNFICTKNNLAIGLTGKSCSGSNWDANQINVQIGKEFKIFKWLYIAPSLGIGYVFFPDFEVGNSSTGASFGNPWIYDYITTSFRDDNYNVNIVNEVNFKLNPIFKLKLMFAYQQALFKLYRPDIVAWPYDGGDISVDRPSDSNKWKYVTVESNGSNTQLGIGLEFILKTFDKKN